MIKTHNPQFENMKIEGRTGTWYVVEIIQYKRDTWYQLESEQHGDEADHIIVKYNTVEKVFDEVNEDISYEILYERD